MSPIYVRPVREQLEHDRLIRQLQTKYQKKFEVAINLGEERLAAVKLGANEFFPDLVLYEAKKLAGVVEVESAESTNNLEAMAQWVHFSRARVPFHLYVPVQAYDTAKRLADANGARITEIWTYRATLDGFDLVRMHSDASAIARSGPKATAVPPKPAPTPPPPAAAVPIASVTKPAAPPPAPKAPVAPPKPAAPPARGKTVPVTTKPVTKPAPAKPAPAKSAPARSAPARSAPTKGAKAAKPVKMAKAAKPAKPAKPAKKASAKAPARAPKKPGKSNKAASGRKR